MEEDALIVCTKCGNSSCLVRLMGEELIDDGERYKRSNDVGNRQVRFRLYRSFTRQMYGVLGKGNLSIAQPFQFQVNQQRPF